jgi:hypothetical protein
MKSQALNQQPLQTESPQKQRPLRLIRKQGPREKEKDERSQLNRIAPLFYNGPIYRAKNYELF